MAKAFDPQNLPKGFPKDGLMMQHGKPYITHVGLVWLANHRGKPWNGDIVSHDIKWNQNGHPHAAVVVYKVWDDEQEHTDIGDACAANVGKMIAPHLIRMASTRAQNRALRAFVGYAGCTADELTIGESYERVENASQQSGGSGGQQRQQPRSEPNRSEPRSVEGDQQQQSPTYSIRTNSPYKCPACGGAVWDNRDSGKKGPLFSCSRKSACPGGKGQYGWGEWKDPHFFDQDDKMAGSNVFTSEDSVASTVRQDIPDGPPPHDDSDIPF
ncbi:MAG: hypothetical protein Unbinned4944contig1000_40 [Prokaryotic dsDNA virus sp.]|nr:MAG: hypothetical protein Unbinned4944contig1000_40 [Prokaryotic dsDNA virus sp.]|tara:strand:- start:75 stop:884 length:810 start_codon:yes stop_codon:yes gene_type:complete